MSAVISVPLTIEYLGQERFGVWMTISSAIAILRLAGLGMGSGVLTAVSEAHGRGDRAAARTAMSSAFYVLLCVALVLSAAFAALYGVVSWPSLFRVRTDLAATEAGPAVAVFAGCFLLGIPLDLFERAQAGYQEGYRNTLWTGCGQLVSIISLLVVIRLRGGLPWLVLAMAGTPLITKVGNIVLLFHRRPWLRPTIDEFRWNTARVLLRRGVFFLLIEVAATVAYTSDNIVVARVFGPDAVTQYSVPMRLATFASTGLLMVLLPLWPAYGEAMARGDYGWVRRALRRTLVLTFLSSLGFAVVLVTFGRDIIQAWVGKSVVPDQLLLVGLAAWTVVGSLGSVVSIVLNAANILAFQVATALTMAATALFLKVFLAQHIGLSGVIWGTVVAYCVCSALPTAILLPRFLAGLKKDGGTAQSALVAAAE